MRVSVIIAVHNERDNLMRTLESLFETTQGLEMEVIVVDDGSKDHPLPATIRKYPRLKTLSFPERRGPGPAKDYGARESRGDTLVFLDSHTKPERGAVRRLVERVEELDGQAVLVPRVPALDVARWENSRSQVGYGYTLDLKTFASKWVALEDLKPSRQFGSQLYESPALIGRPRPTPIVFRQVAESTCDMHRHHDHSSHFSGLSFRPNEYSGKDLAAFTSFGSKGKLHSHLSRSKDSL